MFLGEIAQRSHALKAFYKIGSLFRPLENFLREYSELTKIVMALGVGGLLTFVLQIVFRLIIAG